MVPPTLATAIPSFESGGEGSTLHIGSRAFAPAGNKTGRKKGIPIAKLRTKRPKVGQRIEIAIPYPNVHIPCRRRRSPKGQYFKSHRGKRAPSWGRYCPISFDYWCFTAAMSSSSPLSVRADSNLMSVLFDTLTVSHSTLRKQILLKYLLKTSSASHPNYLP